MKRTILRTLMATLAILAIAVPPLGAAPSSDLQAKIDAKIKDLSWMSTDPKVVAAVKEHNANPPAEAKAMTQDKWKGLSLLDPFVRSLSKNSLAEYLKTKKDESWSELFVSGADGTKVALFSKTSGWSHKGKDKHDVPMKGQSWIGPVEVDQSAGVEQVQVGLPVLDGGKPIGSIVVGLSTVKLK